MHCHTCGKEVPRQAIVCLGCGCPPLVGDKFCQHCGAEANPAASVCIKCGVAPKNVVRESTLDVQSRNGVTSPDPRATKAPPSPLMVGLAIFLFFPVGLFLLWKHPVLGHNKAWWWAGGIWSFLVLVSAMNGDKDKKPGSAEVAQVSTAPLAPATEKPRTSGPTGTTEAVQAQDDATAHGMAPEQASGASSGRHHGGCRTSSWDYKNGCQVIYDGSVTRPEAKRLGDYLEGQGLFDGDVKTFRIGKAGKTYEFRVIVKKGLEQDPEAIEGMKEMGSELSRAVFGDAEVDVHLCDEGFRTIRVIVP